MTDLFSLVEHPLAVTLIWPFALGLLLPPVLRWLAGGATGWRIAVVAVPLGLLAGLVLMLGRPALPPPSSTQKLPYLLTAAAAAAAMLGLLNPRPARIAAIPAALLVVGGGTLWMAGARLGRYETIDLVLLLGGLSLGFVALLGRLSQKAETDGAGRQMLVILAALGLGFVAINGGSASVGQAGFMAAAAGAGFLPWLLLPGRAAFGQAGVVAAGGSLALLAAHLVLSRPSGLVVACLAILLLVPFADGPAARLSNRLGIGQGRFGKPARLVVLGLVAAVPAAIAVAIAILVGAGLPS